MRQLELARVKSTRRRRATLPGTPPASRALEEEVMHEVLRLMAQAIVAVARSEREGGDER
jgi:hypothetical protein